MIDINSKIKIYDGTLVDLLNIKVEDINIYSISKSLNSQQRFNGNIHGSWTVADHSNLVSHLVPSKWALYGLIHDFPESLTGDIVTPIKNILKSINCNVLEYVEDSFNEALYQAFDINPPNEEIKKAVKKADNLAYYYEDACFMNPSTDSYLLFNKYELTKPILKLLNKNRTSTRNLVKYFEELNK